ncbi:hypothetical protein V1522DRAFT_395657 [Lipomyces starkeyi]
MSRVDTAELATMPSLSHTPTSVASSASNQLDSPTPETALRAIKYKEPRKRSYFDKNLKIKLVRLCVLHQGEYVRRRKSQFWNDISRMFEADTGVPIRKPGQTMETLIRKRREELKYRSRVAEADTELKRALDVFMQRYDDVNEEQQERLAQKLAETEANTKAILRQNEASAPTI